MAVESFQASSLRTKIMGGQGFPGPGSAAALNRLPQPLHREFDILRLQVAPALDLGLVAVFREVLEIFCSELLGGRSLPGEFFADERVSGHGSHQSANPCRLPALRIVSAAAGTSPARDRMGRSRLMRRCRDCDKQKTAPLPAPFLVHLRVEPAHFDWRWRERPALALLAWEAVARDPPARLRRI
jgi:hypothetical protein